MTVYLDIIFLENFILNFIILYAVSLVIKEKAGCIKLMIASLIGASYVIIYYLINFQSKWNLIFKIILSVVMVYISFMPKSFKEFIKQIIFFYLVSFVFGGASLGVIYMVNAGRISIRNGIIVGNYTLKTIFIGVILAFTIITVAFKFVKNRISKKDLFCNIKIIINQNKINVKAVIDTGNFLKEPITNIPVIVVEKDILRNFVPKEILENIENILGGDLKNIPENIQNEYMSKLKVIPFSSLGKQNGMLLGIKADGVVVEIDNEEKYVEKVILGIYTKKLSKKDEYNALLGIDVI
jgi:stage II sporulation protein GA (sporulation sigma-E factor processing peptidase)